MGLDWLAFLGVIAAMWAAAAGVFDRPYYAATKRRRARRARRSG